MTLYESTLLAGCTARVRSLFTRQGNDTTDDKRGLLRTKYTNCLLPELQMCPVVIPVGFSIHIYLHLLLLLFSDANIDQIYIHIEDECATTHVGRNEPSAVSRKIAKCELRCAGRKIFPEILSAIVEPDAMI